MISKTPKFDAKLDAIFAMLVPHERECVKCKIKFSIDAGAIDFYKKVRVPPPTRCPDCRRQRRMAFLNYTSLFKRPCEVPGHTEDLISTVPKNAPYPVYDYKYFDSDAWDPFQYAVNYDFSRSFFEQFLAFRNRIPWYALQPFPESIDSEYTFSGGPLKYCYYVMGGRNAEQVYYSNWAFNCERSAELLIQDGGYDIYDATLSYDLVNCRHVWFSKECMNSSFLYDCRNSTDCFGCVGLRNKKYCFWNEQLTKEEYEKKRQTFDLGNYAVLEQVKKDFQEFLKRVPVRGAYLNNAPGCVGNFIDNSKECFMAFDTVGCERCQYVDVAAKLQDSRDLSVGGRSELLYECAAVGKSAYHVVFSSYASGSRESAYLFDSKRCSNCFGCVGLRDKSFCIFNMQYTEKEYWPLLDHITSGMLDRGEYGEFFQMECAPFPYDASFAEVVYPITEEEAKAVGLWWYGDDPVVIPPSTKILEGNDIPLSIKEVSDEIVNQAIRCQVTGRLFRIIKPELELYRRQNIPLPRVHPRVRMLGRFKDAGNFRLQEVACVKCGKKIWSQLDSSKGYKVHCDTCFQQEVV